MKIMRKKQQGFTLIEYMVAITIGLILLAGLGSFFLGMNNSVRAQRAISEVQENGRFALYFLTTDIQKAGWKDPETGVIGGSTRDYIDLAGTSDGNGADSTDTVAIRYESGANCLGEEVTGVVVNQYLVEDDSLKCNTGARSEPIIDGVEALHFTYGIDVNIDGSPDKYVSATELLASPEEAEDVASVKVTMVLVSDTDVSSTNRTQNFTINGQTYTTASDKKLRRLFSTTIFLPNRPKFIGS